MKKKTYEAPVVKKVHLVLKNAVLAVCHTSPILTPRNDFPPSPCIQNAGCFDAS